jgi:outer membrane protein TolC
LFLSLNSLLKVGIFILNSAEATLPPEAQSYLALTPEKSLTLEWVVTQAVRAADSYRGLRAQLNAADAPSLRAGAVLAPQLTGNVSWLDNLNQPQTPFEPTRSRGGSYSIGASSAFSTGTQLSLGVSHGFRELRFAPGGFAVAPFWETRVNVTLSQSLWSNFFGNGTRALIDSGSFASQANRAAYDVAREDWYQQLATLYFQAWLAQARHQASEKNLARQRLLVETVNTQLKRGTAERPDQLQAISARSSSEIQLSQDQQDLGDLWRKLIVTLKLPDHFLAMDPTEIPMKLDTQPQQALLACGANGNVPPPPTQDSAVLQAKALNNAARRQADKARSDLQPSLNLELGYSTNKIDDTSSATLSNVWSLQFPSWSAGLNFRLPLGYRAEKAALSEAAANEIRAASAEAQAVDSARVDWMNNCLTLRRLKQSRDLLVQSAKDQRLREGLERERFNLGRSSTLQLIQAGLDATQAEQVLAAKEVEFQLATLKVLRMNGVLLSYLDRIESSVH